MAAPLAEDVLRELGVEVRKFKSVKGVLLWYDQYSMRRGATRSTSDFAPGGGGKSFAERERERATWARIKGSLKQRAPEVDVFVLHHVWALFEWYEADRSQRELAADLGFPNLHTLRATMLFTERVLRGRLERRGLLEPEKRR